MEIEQVIKDWQHTLILDKIKCPPEVEEAIQLSYENINNLTKDQLLKIKFILSAYNVYLSYEVGKCRSRMIYFANRDKTKYEEYRIKHEMIRDVPINIAAFIRSIGDILKNDSDHKSSI